MSFGQINGIFPHPFPRTLDWTMERIGRPEYAAKFDIVICDPRDSNAVKQIHLLSPHTYCLPTRNWTQGAIFWKPAYDISTIPDVWKLRSSTGVFSQSDDGVYPIYDVTSFCGRYSGVVCGYSVGTNAGLPQGETYGEAIARLIVQNWSPDVWDGYSSDGTCSTPDNEHFNSDYDIERKGENAKTVRGVPWITAQWQAGWNSIYRDIRTRLGSKHRLILYHSIQDTFGLSWMNGAGLENGMTHSPHNFISWKPLQDQLDAGTNLPRVSWSEETFKYDIGNAPSDPHNYFRYLRYALGYTSMTDAYMTIGDPSTPGYSEHLWTAYYDEFDLNLGQATGRSKQIGSSGVWVRFFDNGCIIVNTSNSTQLITNTQITGIVGYAGPYLRFKGNQDPVWNDGSQFSSATLISTTPSWSGASQNVGDAVFLVKTPTTIVSDIYVDNAYSPTSPGSPIAVLTGSWSSDFSIGYPNNTWENAMPQQSVSSKWLYHMTTSGGSSNTAMFAPKLNIVGNYNVYEWHGTKSGAATSVPCMINSTSLVINQSINQGKWNLLGKFQSPIAVVIKGSTGITIADAFKFQYVGTDVQPIPNPICFTQAQLDSAKATVICPACPPVQPCDSIGVRVRYYNSIPKP